MKLERLVRSALAAVLLLLCRRANADVHYVARDGHHVAPFTNWQDAATDIQAAIDVSSAGDRILVGDGEYATGGRTAASLMTRVVIDRAVTVCSVNGATGATIRGVGPIGASAVRCAYVGDGAVLSGFTLTNGATTAVTGNSSCEGGGAYCTPGGVLTNCVLTGNKALYGGGAFGGMLVDCDLIENAARYAGGGAMEGTLTDCGVFYNTMTAGGSAGIHASAATRCVILNNTTAGGMRGGGAGQSSLTNCILAYNEAGHGGGAADSDLVSCLVVSNYASAGRGGGLRGGLGSFRGFAQNSIFLGNGAYTEGGAADSSTLQNCTLADNVAGFGYDGVSGDTYWSSLENCILLNNDCGEANVTYSTYYGCTIANPSPGVGCLAADPKFEAAPNGDFRLTAASPCIDKGTNAAWMTASTDYEGKPRIIGGRVDMGAFEFRPSDPLLIRSSVANLRRGVLAGQDTPVSSHFELWSSGTTTGALSYTLEDDRSWMSVEPSGGTSTGEHDVVRVDFFPAGLPLGMSNGTLTITAPAATNSPLLISVELHILAPDEDSDMDGLSNGDEVARGTDPLDSDTDDDGLNDGDEIVAGTDPTNRFDRFAIKAVLVSSGARLPVIQWDGITGRAYTVYGMGDLLTNGISLGALSGMNAPLSFTNPPTASDLRYFRLGVATNGY